MVTGSQHLSVFLGVFFFFLQGTGRHWQPVCHKCTWVSAGGWPRFVPRLVNWPRTGTKSWKMRSDFQLCGALKPHDTLAVILGGHSSGHGVEMGCGRARGLVCSGAWNEAVTRRRGGGGCCQPPWIAGQIADRESSHGQVNPREMSQRQWLFLLDSTLNS